MIKTKNPLLNKDFLLKLDNQKNREVFVRITSLDINEQPVEQIEGKVTSSGSISVNGSSDVRRSCSLTLLASLDTKITETYWALKTKFKLDVGLVNNVDKDYDKIIWFKQGIYVINSFSLSQTPSSYNVSISGQDKMALLNGSLGGKFLAETIIDTIDIEEEETEGVWVTVTHKVPIYQIIREIVHNYGNESFENIIINDIPEAGYELWEYRGIEPIYYLIYDDGTYFNMFSHSNVKNWIFQYETETEEVIEIDNIDDFNDQDFYQYNSIFSNIKENAKLVKVKTSSDGNFSEKSYYIARIQPGELAGYHRTELIYPGKNGALTAAAGSSVVEILKKIKDMLGNYEYFYNLDGKFVFQKQQNYTQGIITTTTREGATVPSITVTPYSYKFENSELLTNVSKNPTIDKVKNNFCVWGAGKTIEGNDKPIHAVFAVMKQPMYYKTIGDEDKEYYTSEYCRKKSIVEDNNDNVVDYREVIYQMALDFYKHNQDPDFTYQIITKNREFYPTGKTGYEPFYQELQGFWRQLYDPNPKNTNEYFTEDDLYAYWHKSTILDPTNINFWFEIIDTGGELSERNIEKIGNRTEVKNEKTVTTIVKKDTPEIVFKITEEQSLEDTMSLTEIQISKNQSYDFVVTSSGISAMEYLDSIFSENILGTEGLNLTCVPIYYLEPNTRIYVKKEDMRIDGDYLVSQLSIPLTYNGTMSITASAVIKEI